MSTLIKATDIEIVVEGRVLKSNLSEFCAQLKGVISLLDRELSTDADFEAADKDAKFLKSAERSLRSAKNEALKQAEDIQKLFAAIDDVSEEARQARLGLERQIKTRKEERKLDIIEDGLRSLDSDNIYFGRERIEFAVKGKKNLSSMSDAVACVVDKIKKEVQDARIIIESFADEHGKSLMPDVKRLEQMQPEPLEAELERRVERAKAEAEMRRMEAEIASQKAEAKAKAEAEMRRMEAEIASQKAEAKAKAEKQKREIEAAKPEPNEPADEYLNRIAPSVKNPEFERTTEIHTLRTSKPFSVIEFEAFLEVVRSAMLPVKEARSELKNPINIEKTTAFARTINQAWEKLTGGAS